MPEINDVKTPVQPELDLNEDSNPQLKTNVKGGDGDDPQIIIEP